MSSFLMKMSKIRLSSVSDSKSKLDFRFKMYPRILVMFHQYMFCLKCFLFLSYRTNSKNLKSDNYLTKQNEQNSFSAITSKLLRILIEHIQQKYSIDSKLQIEFICSVVISNIFEVIAFKNRSK